MKSINVTTLTEESFRPYGEFARLINPDGHCIGSNPIEFYRDMVSVKLDRQTCANIGVNRVEQRPPKINVSEYHNFTAEGLLPLDGDVLIHVGEATHTGQPNYEELKVFYVPKGTFVALNPGVWHHASYTVNTPYVNVLILLPERTYMNDCHVVEYPADEVRTIILEEESLDYEQEA